MASIIVGLCHCVIKVLIAKRRVGGVLIIDKSRICDNAIFI
jgi:hypothetical protein